jgi:excisionase family DNA binding protein
MTFLLTVEEAANELRLGRTRTYELVAAGIIRSVKVGRSRRVPATEIARYVERLLAEQAGDDADPR